MAGIAATLQNAKENVQHAAERKAFSLIAEKLAKDLHGNPNKTDVYLKILDQADRFYGKSATPEILTKVRAYLSDPENRWVKYIGKIIGTHCRKCQDN